MDPVNPTVMDRDALDAFVDGALSPEESARVVLHLADHPSDAAYVDALMEANALLAAAYAGPLHQPVPERLRAAIFPAAPRARGRGRWPPRASRARRAALGALAASVAVALAALLAPTEDRLDAPGAGEAERAALAEALETDPSGAVAQEADAAEITLIATFRDAEGRPCREYEIRDPAEGELMEGLACRDAAGWTTEIEVASRTEAPVRAPGGFIPAEGAEAGALDAALDRLGAGMVLTPAEEQALIASRWAP